MKLVNFLIQTFKCIVFTFYILFCLYVCYGTYLNLVDVVHTTSIIFNMDIDKINNEFFIHMLVLLMGALSVVGVIISFVGAVVLYDKLFYSVKKEESDLNVS